MLCSLLVLLVLAVLVCSGLPVLPVLVPVLVLAVLVLCVLFVLAVVVLAVLAVLVLVYWPLLAEALCAAHGSVPTRASSSSVASIDTTRRGLLAKITLARGGKQVANYLAVGEPSTF